MAARARRAHHLWHEVLHLGGGGLGALHAGDKVVQRLHREVPAILIGNRQLPARQGAQHQRLCITRQRLHIAPKLRAVAKPLLDVGDIQRPHHHLGLAQRTREVYQRRLAVQIADVRNHPMLLHQATDVLIQRQVRHPGRATAAPHHLALHLQVRQQHAAIAQKGRP